MSSFLNRANTLADIRPCHAYPKRKKNIFSKMWKSFSKLGRSSSKANLYNSTRHMGLSFGGSSIDGSDSGVITAGSTTTRRSSTVNNLEDFQRDGSQNSDSASTGYASEGSSARSKGVKKVSECKKVLPDRKLYSSKMSTPMLDSIMKSLDAAKKKPKRVPSRSWSSEEISDEEKDSSVYSTTTVSDSDSVIDNSSSEEAPPPVLLKRHVPARQFRTYCRSPDQLKKFSFQRELGTQKQTLKSASSAQIAPVAFSGAVRNIAAKFAEGDNFDDDFSQLNIGQKEHKPEGIRRTQSTRIQALAASFQASTQEIETKQSSPATLARSQTTGQNRSSKLTTRSDSTFMKSLIEMAKSDGMDEPGACGRDIEINDFKSQISLVSTKMHLRRTMTIAEPEESHYGLESVHDITRSKSEAVPSNMQSVDPFVAEVLGSGNIPEGVKQKIREECWSLFNDAKTPRGVKQCILNTMLSKYQASC